MIPANPILSSVHVSLINFFSALLLAVSFLLLGMSQAFSQNTEITETWQWPDERWRDAVNKVRAGDELVPERWPQNSRVAVALSFDFDSETLSLRTGITTPSMLSSGQYGARVGVPKILALLEKYEIPATFFIPGVSAELYPQQVRNIASGDHEIGLHSWIHEATPTLARDDERMLMQRAMETLQRISGQQPVGIRTGAWEYSENTLELIEEFDLLYDSSLMADDNPYELLADDQPTGIVELPVEWILDDYPYFGMDRLSAIRPHMTPNEVLEIWSAEFDRAYAEGGLFLLTMHPQLIGHGSRIQMLEELIQYIRSYPDVWFATHKDVANVAASLIE